MPSSSFSSSCCCCCCCCCCWLCCWWPDGGYLTDDYVEYDLDNEDEDYFEGSGLMDKVTADKFERMLWRLELACAEATDAALSAAGWWTAAVAHRPGRLQAQF